MVCSSLSPDDIPERRLRPYNDLGEPRSFVVGALTVKALVYNSLMILQPDTPAPPAPLAERVREELGWNVDPSTWATAVLLNE